MTWKLSQAHLRDIHQVIVHKVLLYLQCYFYSLPKHQIACKRAEIAATMCANVSERNDKHVQRPVTFIWGIFVTVSMRLMRKRERI